MEHYKIFKLLNDSTVLKFVAKEWIKINDLLKDQYFANQNIRFKTSMLWSDLCDYRVPYIAVKERISFRGTTDANRINKKLTFKNNAPFRSYIKKSITHL